MIITFDPLDKIQRSLVRWKAFAKAFRSTPPTPNLATQLESEITKPPWFSYSQKTYFFE
jgi:hypothetical protein